MKAFWFCVFFGQLFSLHAANLPIKFNSIDSLPKHKNYFVIAEYQRLRSTHASIFNGFNLILAKKLNTSNTLGVGIEYSWAPFHGDNGFNLYKLRFLPLFIDYRHYFFIGKKINPFVMANVGYSFSGYDEEENGKPLTKHRVKEGGVYLAGAIGTQYKICRNLSAMISVGFKGFHNTLNNLDVNPHGIVLRTGLSFNFN